MEQRLEKMAAEAARELRAYGRFNLKEAAKNTVKKALGRGTAKRDPAFWPAGMLALGLEEYAAYAERVREKETQGEGQRGAATAAATTSAGQCGAGAMADAAVSQFLEKWINGGAKVTYVDDALAGYVLLRRWERLTRRAQSASQETEAPERLRAAADSIAAQLKALPRNADGAILYRPGRGNAYVFADGAGMAAMFLAKYGRLFGDAEAQTLAASQLLAFLRCGMDDRSGLPYHGYERKKVKAARESDGAAARAGQAMRRASAEAVRQTGEAECQAGEACCKYGLIGWGRAVGWLLMGLRVAAECMLEDGAALRQGCRRLLEAALAYQRADGSFAWQLTAQEGPADTSATAMIAYAALGALEAAEAVDGYEKQSAEKVAAVSDGGEKQSAEKAAAADGGEKQSAEKSAEAADRCEKCGEKSELLLRLRRAAEFLNAQTDAEGLVGGALAECLGFAEHPQRYGAFPWGQGAALAAGSALAARMEAGGALGKVPDR